VTFRDQTVIRTGFLALVLVFASGPLVRGETAPRRVIEYRDDDTLSVDLVGVPLSEILAEIARQTHAEIRGAPREAGQVTARFEGVPLSEALDRLLCGQSYALIYGEDGMLRAIPLLGSPQISSSPARELGMPLTAPGSLPPDVASLFARPLPVAGSVADALGASTANLSQLMRLWLEDEDATVREQSVRSGFRAVENAAELRAATIDFANASDAGDLATLFRNFAGSRAEELVDTIAKQTKVTELRNKATLVLRQLQAGG